MVPTNETVTSEKFRANSLTGLSIRVLRWQTCGEFGLCLVKLLEDDRIDKAIQILIVEDHHVTLDGLNSGLSREPDLKVIGTATTSDEGLDYARLLSPDIVLLDLHLPGSTGPKTTVKEFLSASNSQVIVFSGENRMAFIQTVLGLGVAGYLLKSESVAKVADAIRQVMAGKKPVLSAELITGETKVTRSEQEVLKMLARGMKYSDIADHRQASPATVRKQCELLLLKLGLDSREQLIAWAVQSGYGNLELEV